MEDRMGYSKYNWERKQGEFSIYVEVMSTQKIIIIIIIVRFY